LSNIATCDSAVERLIDTIVREHRLPVAMRATALFELVRLPVRTREAWLNDGGLTVVKPAAQDRYLLVRPFLRRWLSSALTIATDDLLTIEAPPIAPAAEAVVEPAAESEAPRPGAIDA
jgi:hypothetical protein